MKKGQNTTNLKPYFNGFTEIIRSFTSDSLNKTQKSRNTARKSKRKRK